MFDFSAERTLQSVDESLARLGVEYVDIIQVHFSSMSWTRCNYYIRKAAKLRWPFCISPMGSLHRGIQISKKWYGYPLYTFLY